MSESTSNRSKFVFSDAPFASTPNPDAFCEVSTCAEALNRSRRAVEHSEGPAILIGGPGTGKTIICMKLAEIFADRFHVVPLLDSHPETSRELLQAILYQLDLPYRDLAEGEMRLSLLDFLRPKGKADDEGLLLIVDEAHQMGVELLEEIRMISSVTALGKPRVRTILAGASKLDETLTDPQLASFAQRIAARCYLSPFTGAETAIYIQSRLRRVGVDASSLIDDSAIRRVHSACDGIPRLINQLMTHALYFAESRGNQVIGDSLVQAAWADLQQLPVPLAAKQQSEMLKDSAKSTASEVEGIVEFGELDPAPVSDRNDPSSDHVPSSELPACETAAMDAEDASHSEGFSVSVSAESAGDAEGAGVEGAGIDVVGHGKDNIPVDLAAGLEVVCRDSSASRLHDSTGAESQSVIMGDQYSGQDGDPMKVDADVDVDVENLQDFPVVHLRTNHSTDQLIGSELVDSPTPSTEANLGEEELTAENACYRDDVLRTADGKLGEDLATEIHFATASERAVDQSDVMAVVNDRLWQAAVSSNPPHCEPREPKTVDRDTVRIIESSPIQPRLTVVGDPFGADYDEEFSIHDNNAQELRVAVGKNMGRSVRRLEIASQDNDAKTEQHMELEHSLHAEVVSINREARSPNKAVMQGYFDKSQFNTPGVVSDISVNGDDRDLMIIEDQVNDQAAQESRPTSQTNKPDSNLSNLFSRIREG